MKVNLSHLFEGKVDSIELNFEYILKETNDLKENYDIIKASPFHFSGKIYKSNEKINISLEFTGDLRLQCSRCLKDFKKSISGILESEISFEENTDEDYDGIILKGDILDLSDSLEEAITLSLPMKAICNEECKGLCPECGIDLNVDTCKCNQEKVDPRLEKLKNFFEKDKEV